MIQNNTIQKEYVHDYAQLDHILSENISVDPYMNSSAYVAMTGRKGLHVYQGQFSKILYSEHPNLSDTGIIFPPNNEKGITDVLGAIQSAGNLWQNLQVIRVPEKKTKFWSSILRGTTIEEKTLDYTFPVYTVETSDLIEMAGPQLYNFKKTLNKIDKTLVSTKKIDFFNDRTIIIQLLIKWEKQTQYDVHINTAEPAIYVLDNLGAQLNLDGLITYIDDKPVGFSIWEKPTNQSSTANAIIHCALHIKGLSELLHHQMSKTLLNDGIKNLCIGGSETKGLNAFKKKMNPVKETLLKTIVLK